MIDVADAIGIKKRDDVLLAGGKSGLSALKRCSSSVTIAVRQEEMERLRDDLKSFERVFVYAGGFPHLLHIALKLTKRGGTISFIDDDPLIRLAFRSKICELLGGRINYREIGTNIGTMCYLVL